MKKFLFAVCGLFFAIGSANAALPLLGFYKTIDDNTGNAKAIVKLYDCGGNMCGRIVALFNADGTEIEETISNPVRVAEKLENHPYMDGLDILWNMSWDARNNRFSGGRIMDPKDGRTYTARVWADPDDATLLRVRGSIGPFGRTQVWHVVNAADLPKDLQKLDVSKWEVVIPDR